MATRIRFILFNFLLLTTLVGCAGGAFGGFLAQSEIIDDALVVRELRYSDQGRIGPAYTVSIFVPDAWVGNFETRTSLNKVTFYYVMDNGRRAPIFDIQLLSDAQYWEQNGSYPGTYRNILTNPDSYFVYSLPLDSFYSGLPDAMYVELAEIVPEVITTFTAEKTGGLLLTNFDLD